MSTEERPAKRARPDGESDAERTIERSPQFWLDDGSIVLQVETTQFRVPKALLAAHSSVFRDMFSLPLPPDEPRIEGSPVVVLSGDTSEDWTELLGAMWPQDCFSNKKPTVKQVAAILRLSKKYDIAAFRQRCLQLLKYDFPITFPKYSMAYKSLFSAKIAYAGPLPVSVALVEVINLAREAGLYSILPAAFYRFLNFTRLGEFSNQIMQALSLADQVVCLQGHARMTDTYARTPLSWLDGIPCEDCTDDGDCYAARNEMIRELGTDNTSILHHFFENWDEVWDDHFCKHCVVNAKQEHHHQVQYYWKLLPGYFNLPPWEELVKMDFE